METIKTGFGALWLVALLYSQGILSRRLLRSGPVEGSVDFILSLAFGYVFLAAVSTVAAFKGYFTPGFIAAISLEGGCLFLFRSFRRTASRETAGFLAFLREEAAACPAWMKAALGAFSLLFVVKTLSPASHADAVNVYLNFPKFQSLSGRLWSDYPLRGDFCYLHSHLSAALGYLVSKALSLSDFSNVLPRFSTGLLPVFATGVLVAQFAKDLFPSRSHAFPVLLFLTIDAVVTMAFDGKTFGLSLLFEFLFLFLWARALENSSIKTYTFSFLFLSFGLATLPQVYFNIPPLPLLLLVSAVAFHRQNRLGPGPAAPLEIFRSLGFASELIALAVLVVLIFPTMNEAVVSSWKHTPFDLGYLPTPSSVRGLSQQRFFRGFSGFFQLIYSYSLRKEVIAGAGQNFGPLAMVFAGFCVPSWLSKKDLLRRTLFLYFLAYFAEFFLVKQTSRHALLALAGFVLPASHLYEGLMRARNPRWTRVMIRGALAVIFSLMFFRGVQHSLWRKHFQFLAGKERLEDFVERVHSGLYPFLPDGRLERFLKGHLAPDENFLVDGDLPPLLYFSKLPVQLLKIPEGDFHRYLQANRVRYVLLPESHGAVLRRHFASSKNLNFKPAVVASFPFGRQILLELDYRRL